MAKNDSLADFVTQATTGSEWNIIFNRDLRQTEISQVVILLQYIGPIPPPLDEATDSYKWTLTTTGDGDGHSQTPLPTLSTGGTVKGCQRWEKDYGASFLRQ
ncbi:hypothetical protein BVC80_517g2 [Macleaya cordata]|uniref:Uncharacterized protein n=1 Tax=Macleaya cordata TaxID=56857 RepID=A0A200PYJ4_MACCD|nr:hypothetical protein BVC80_517g2 [Macleaya cordata]